MSPKPAVISHVLTQGAADRQLAAPFYLGIYILTRSHAFVNSPGAGFFPCIFRQVLLYRNQQKTLRAFFLRSRHFRRSVLTPWVIFANTHFPTQRPVKGGEIMAFSLAEALMLLQLIVAVISLAYQVYRDHR